MMADFGEKVAVTVCSDAPAAIGIAHRQGLGKTRHIEVQYPWIQKEVKEGKLTVKRVDTNNNPADLLTKAMNGERVMKCMAEMGFDIDNSRASTAPTLQRATSPPAASRSKQGDHNAEHRGRGGGEVKIRSPASESAACASRVERPNPTGDDHKWRP